MQRIKSRLTVALLIVMRMARPKVALMIRIFILASARLQFNYGKVINTFSTSLFIELLNESPLFDSIAFDAIFFYPRIREASI